MNVLESTRNIPRQFGTNYFSVVFVVGVQQFQCVIWLKELDDPREYKLSYCSDLRTSFAGSRKESTSSGAFLISSIS